MIQNNEIRWRHLNKIRSISIWIQDKAIIFIFTLLVLIPTSPLNSPFAARDSGVFLYTGWRILNGDIPYVDVWDHKPPIIFFINALGLWLANNSRWGVWLIEFISLFIAAYIGFKLFSKIFGYFPAILSTYFWMYSLVFLITNGNLTEEYLLPLQFLTFCFFYYAQRMQKKYLYYLFIGIMGGLAFFIKQTSAGIWIAIIIFLGYEGIRNQIIKKCIKEISTIIIGSLGVAIIIIGYFFINNALYEFWDSAFLYNFFYSFQRVNSLSARFWNFVDVHNITKMGFFQIAVIGIASFIFKIYKRNNELHRGAISLLMVGMIDFPLELLLINIPGKAYEHYFVTILPTLTLFSCLLFYLVNTSMTNIQTITKKKKSIMIFAFLFILVVSGMRDYRNNVLGLRKRSNEEAIRYILSRTDPDDSILVLGAETMVNFYTRRNSPTRYVYQYPLYREGYTSEEKIIEFLDDIIDNKPEVIMNSMGEDDPLFSFPIQSKEIEEKQEYIKSTYQLVDEVNTWGVYEYK